MSSTPCLAVAVLLCMTWAPFISMTQQPIRTQMFTTVDDYVNVCLDGSQHKDMPGPEDTLFSECSPYQMRSCCTPEVSRYLHLNKTWYKLNRNHCGRPLSQKCNQHFDKDLCFYECSADVGPWLVHEGQRPWRTERYYQVPLCQSECEQWYNDCQDDLTCVDNWSLGFSWNKGTMSCPVNSNCSSFETIFKSATNFCEKIWDYSFKVVDDSQPCMKLWFDQLNNPNAAVALARAKELVSAQEVSGSVREEAACPATVVMLLACIAAFVRCLIQE